MKTIAMNMLMIELFVFFFSLNPDEERLAFSVVWRIDTAGNVTSEWFGRSIIRSCAKLSYDHAQVMDIGLINLVT